MQTKQKQKIIGAVALLALLFFFLPEHFVHAGNGWFGIPDGSDLMAYIFKAMFEIIGQLMAIVAKALNTAVFVRPGGNVLVVATTWKILRDFSNMIFIVLLIYMAFATIFDQGKYTFKDMIVRFLIVAVLINFSLVIGNLIIDACQVLTNIFLGSIGNVGDRLGQYLNPSLLLPNAKSITGVDMAGGGLISLVFAIILSSIFLFSLLVALVFAIIRVPFIWALLIISPLAWMSYVLPGTNKWWSQWWSLFFGWNLFLPVYLFFMYIGLLFLSKRDEIIGAVITANTTANPANAPLLDGLANSLSFNLVFFYIFAGVVMVGGTWAAKATTSWMGGTGFEKGLGWAKGLVKSVPLPYVGNLKAGEAASKARFNQFQQEGFKQGGFINKWTGGAANKIYGGKDAQSRADAKAKGFFGVQGAGKEFVSEVDKEANKLREDEKLGKIQVNEAFKTATAGTSNTSARGVAMRSLLYERGMIDEKEFANDMASWTQSNPILAQSMAEKAKKGKYKSVKPEELLKMAMAEGPYTGFRNPESIVLRKGWFDFLKDNDKALNAMTLEQYGTAISLLGGPKTNDAAEYKKAIAKKRLDLVTDFDIKEKKLDKDPRIRVALLMKELKDKKAIEIGQMSEKVWNDPDFAQALELNMKYLDKNDPPVEAGEALPGGGVAKKRYSGGGANFKASLRKSVARSGPRLRIIRGIRPGELGGEIADETPEKSADAIKREADIKTEADTDDKKSV